MGIFDCRLHEQFVCNNSSIKISKPVRYDELSHPNEILEEKVLQRTNDLEIAISHEQHLKDVLKITTEVNEMLIEMGWKVFRFWEHEIKEDVEKCVTMVREKINQ